MCEDINECKNLSLCHMNANCTNTNGSYKCTCNVGFMDDGKNCVVSSVSGKELIALRPVAATTSLCSDHLSIATTFGGPDS